MKAFQWTVNIAGMVANNFDGVRRGDLMDVDGINLTESTALMYAWNGYAVPVNGRPLHLARPSPRLQSAGRLRPHTTI